MGNGEVTLDQLHRDILSLFQEVSEIRKGVEDLRDVELRVRPEYSQKLRKIEQGKFLSRADLDRELGD